MIQIILDIMSNIIHYLFSFNVITVGGYTLTLGGMLLGMAVTSCVIALLFPWDEGDD